MKARRVVLTVEVETDAPLRNIRKISCERFPDEYPSLNEAARGLSIDVFSSADSSTSVKILQISANVIREKKRKGKR